MGAELNSSLFKALFPENYYLISRVVPWKTICKAVVFDQLRTYACEIPFPGGKEGGDGGKHL